MCQQFYILPRVNKSRFGPLIHEARSQAGLSLRELAAHTGIDFTRLSKIEHGTRPAPGLSEIRALADFLNLDMVDLLVAGGTSREVVGALLWWERLRMARAEPSLEATLPERAALRSKNRFSVAVQRRDGGLCEVQLDAHTRLTVFSFSDADSLRIEIPPEAVTVLPYELTLGLASFENALRAQVAKIRHLGQVTNLVLRGRQFELNSLHTKRQVQRQEFAVGSDILAIVPAAAIRTVPMEEAR